jgi:hypothetical protein
MEKQIGQIAIKKREVKPITKEFHNLLVDKFNCRIKGFGKLSKNKILEMQAEFFIGAFTAFDFVNDNNETSSITPIIFYSIIRGDIIKRID